MRTYGTQAIGIRAPIVREGDDLPRIAADSVLAYCKESGSHLQDGDIVGITEAVVARAQGNYATTAQIAADLRRKIPSGTVGVVFPILSRNRFSILLRGLAAGADSLVIQLSYPSDEVGNHIVNPADFYTSGVKFEEVFEEEAFRARFGDLRHTFTDIDYPALYRELGGNARIIFANDPCEILKHTKNVIAADIHTREQTKSRLRAAGAKTVLGLDDILTESVDGSGCNADYGLLGSNKAGEDRVKLFPHSCGAFVSALSTILHTESGARVEVMIYGDGAFKDPVGKIWELADPVVSPAFTKGLDRLPNELKLKYIADNELADKRGEDARQALVERIRQKPDNLMGTDVTEGTTPRRMSDLVGSLCDLTSGSGDKGTPIVLIKGYFDSYADE